MITYLILGLGISVGVYITNDSEDRKSTENLWAHVKLVFTWPLVLLARFVL